MMWRSLHNDAPLLRGLKGPHIKGITQSTSAQAFNILGILAGFILAGSYGLLHQYPWALLIFPGLLSNRGAIGGLFSGRLSTGLHLGTISSDIINNTDEAYQLYSAVVTLTGFSAVLLVMGGGVFSVLIYGVGLSGVIQLALVIVSTLALSIMAIMPVTFLVSKKAYDQGLDPDMIVYPITSTTADITISLIYVSMLRLVSWSNPFGRLIMMLLALVFAFAVSWLHVRSHEKASYSKTLREFAWTLVVVTVIVTLTGHVLERISRQIGGRAGIYAIYPAMIDTVGDVGSIIGSTATTKLGLGLLGAELKSIRGHLNEISYAWIGSLFLFTVYATISGVLYGFMRFRSLLAAVWCSNLLVMPLIALVSFSVGITTYKLGLDPDNFVIPFETSLADSLTTVILYLMILVWY